MKVVILCGGQGTRLREETEYKPKPMVEVGGKPILWHIMKLYSSYGFNDFVLCLGYKHEVIREYFLNYRGMNTDVVVSLASGEVQVLKKAYDEDWNVTLAYTGEETKKGARLKMVSPYLGGERFMVTYGDGVTDLDIRALVASHEDRGLAVTFTGVHPISRFATVEQDAADRVINWAEKRPLEGYINGGFLVMEPEVLEYITGDVEWEDEPMTTLAQEGKVAMYKHEGFWHCMDTYRDYMLLNQMWGTGKAPWKVWSD